MGGGLFEIYEDIMVVPLDCFIHFPTGRWIRRR
jgi:hypothetical protein